MYYDAQRKRGWMILKIKMILTCSAILIFAAIALTLLFCFSTSGGSGLIREGIPSVEEIINSIKQEEYEKLQNSTGLIRDYISALFNNT